MSLSKTEKKLGLMMVFLLATVLLVMAGGEQEKRTITIWSGYPECIPVFKAAAADYMAENPNVTFEISGFKMRESEQKYAISLPAGTAPDLYDASAIIVNQFIADSMVEPVPGNVESWLKDNYDPVAYECYASEGKYYGIPWLLSCQLLFYNLDHYRQAGLYEPPETLEELMSYAQKLAKYDDAGNLSRSGISLRLSGGGMGVAEKFEIFLYPYGGSVLEPTAPGKLKANFANEAGYQALNFYLQALHKYKVDSFKVKHDAEAFVSGITSQFVRETWVIGQASKRAPEMNYGIAQVVGGPAQRATNYAINGWVVPSINKNKELDWDFAMYLNKDKYLVQMMKDVGWTCTRKGVDYSEAYKKEPHFEQALDLPKGFKHIPIDTVVSFKEAYTKFASRLVETYTSGASMVDNRDKIMSFLEEANQEVNTILKSNGEYSE